MAWRCEKWQALPEGGGMMDQDYQLIRRMTALSNIWEAVVTWRNATGDRIHTLSDHTRKILRYLLDSGISFNG